MFVKITKPFFALIAKILYRYKKIQEENVPKNDSAIICSNHIHAMDGPLVIVATKRHVKCMAKMELFKTKPLSWLMNKYGTFPVTRGKLDKVTLQKAYDVIEEGNILGVFPEGGRREGLTRQTKLKNGAAYMAVTTGAPVVPVAIKGSFKIFSKVRLRYGKPISFAEYKTDKPDKEILNEVSSKIANAIVDEMEKL